MPISHPRACSCSFCCKMIAVWCVSLKKNPCAGRFFFDLGLHFLMDWSSGNSAQGSTRGGHELSAACGILEL